MIRTGKRSQRFQALAASRTDTESVSILGGREPEMNMLGFGGGSPSAAGASVAAWHGHSHHQQQFGSPSSYNGSRKRTAYRIWRKEVVAFNLAFSLDEEQQGPRV